MTSHVCEILGFVSQGNFIRILLVLWIHHHFFNHGKKGRRILGTFSFFTSKSRKSRKYEDSFRSHHDGFWKAPRKHGKTMVPWDPRVCTSLGYFKRLKMLKLEFPSFDFALWQIMKLVIPFYREAGYNPQVKFSAGIISELNFKFKLKKEKRNFGKTRRRAGGKVAHRGSHGCRTQVQQVPGCVFFKDAIFFGGYKFVLL